LHISIVAYGTWGDVRPAIALGRALKAAGYGVRLIVTEDFAGWVNNTGLDIHLLPVDKFAVMKQVSSQTNPLRVMLAVHREIAPALLQAGRDLLALAEDTDVFLVNEWLLGIASGIAEVHQLKLVNLAQQPGIKTREMPISTMPALPERAPFRETYNLLSYRLAQSLRWFSYVRQLNSLRETHLDLAPLSFREYLDLLDRTPSITLVSRHVISRPADWQDHHHLTGFLFYEDDNWRPPPELEDFIHAGQAPVYVGFGSMHDRHPDQTTRLILDALEYAHRRAVLYKGWAGLGQSDVPDTVYLLDYAPHRWLFPRMAAVVHHAGAGTSAAALHAGVPSVPVPHSGDQLFWARRLYQLGAGAKPLPRNRLSALGLAERIAGAVRDSQLRSRAAELGARISAEDGAGRAVAAIDDVLQKS
jgi:UDP:flavonoid glycosyltransferase YjiC (YdhE family)